MKDLKTIQEFFSKPLEESKELEGSMAAQKGKKYSENPYKKGTKDHLEWSKGHNASRASKLSVKEDMFGNPLLKIFLDQIFEEYTGKMIEMDFTDPESDWSKMLGKLEEYLPGDQLSDFMSSKKLDKYLDDYNIRLIDPIVDKEIDPEIVKRGKAKIDIDAMRKAGNMPPLDSIASLNEAAGVLSIGDTLTPNMWDKQKIEMGIRDKSISDPFWFTKPHKIINLNSKIGMISFDHPAKPKRSETWVNKFLKDGYKLDFSEYPEGELDAVYSKGRMSENLPPIKDTGLLGKVLGQVKAKKIQQSLIDKGYELGKDFTVVQDRKNPKMFNISPAMKLDEGAVEIMDAYNRILDLLKKESRALNDDDSYALGLKLKSWFSKNILDENKPVANPNKHIKGIQIQLDQLGVKYKMDPENKVQPFKAIYKPVNKDDEWYDNFNDIVFRYNLKDVVKTSMNEATEDAIYYLQQAIKLSHTNTVRKLILKAIRELGLEVPKVWTESTNASVNENLNPEVSKTVNRFIKAMAKRYNYSEQDAVYAVMSALRQEGFQGLNEATEQLSESKYLKYADLIDLVNKADNPRNLPIYYNSDFGVVNIGGVGYDKGELVKMFRSKPGTSLNIKNIFFKANQNPEQTAKDVNSFNMGVKAEVDYGYGKEPFIKFTKGYSDEFLDQMAKDQMDHDEETLRRERGLEEIKQRIFNKLKK
jgi:hypothetical protein